MEKAEEIENPTEKTIFLQIAEEEDKHKKILEEIVHVIAIDACTEEQRHVQTLMSLDNCFM